MLREILPLLFRFAAILIVAYIVGRVLAWAIATFLRKIGAGKLTRKTEAERIAHWFGTDLIGLVEVVIRWTIYLVGLQIALETAGLKIVDQLMQRIVSYMPNLILALIIFVIGIVVAEKIGNVVQRLAEDERVPRFWILGNVVKYAIYLVVVIMTLSHLQISTGVLMVVTGSVFAAIALTTVVGMRDIAPNVVAGMHLLYEKTLNVGDNIQLGEHEGIIEEIGLVKSIIKKKNGEYLIIPNSELMKTIVMKK